MKRTTALLTAFGAIALPPGLPLAQDGAAKGPKDTRPEFVAQMERRFNGRSMFTTAGDGVFTLYQRLERPISSVETTCLLHSCYARLAEFSEADARALAANEARRQNAMAILVKADDAQKRLAETPQAEKAAQAKIWMNYAGRVSSCLSGGKC